MKNLFTIIILSVLATLSFNASADTAADVRIAIEELEQELETIGDTNVQLVVEAEIAQLEQELYYLENNDVSDIQDSLVEILEAEDCPIELVEDEDGNPVWVCAE